MNKNFVQKHLGKNPLLESIQKSKEIEDKNYSLCYGPCMKSEVIVVVEYFFIEHCIPSENCLGSKQSSTFICNHQLLFKMKPWYNK